jgi:hypothetical protein
MCSVRHIIQKWNDVQITNISEQSHYEIHNTEDTVHRSHSRLHGSLNEHTSPVVN